MLDFVPEDCELNAGMHFLIVEVLYRCCSGIDVENFLYFTGDITIRELFVAEG